MQKTNWRFQHFKKSPSLSLKATLSHKQKQKFKHLFFTMLPLLMPGNTSFMLREKITEFATEDILGHIKVDTSLMLLHVKL